MAKKGGGVGGVGQVKAAIVGHLTAKEAVTEAGQRVQPNLSRYTVATVIWTF